MKGTCLFFQQLTRNFHVMTIYILYYFLILACSVFCSVIAYRSKSKKTKTFIFLLLFLGVFIIVAFRSPSMGRDLGIGSSEGYLARFKYISKTGFVDLIKGHSTTYQTKSYDIGYVLFNKLISYVSNDYQWLIVCAAFLSLFPVYYVFNKESSSICFSIVIYLGLTCFLATFSALRQACAISICFLSYTFIKERRFFPFLFIVLLASLFHSSALICLLIYPFYSFRIGKKARGFTLVLVFVVFILRRQFFSVFAGLFGKNYNIDDNGAILLFLFFLGIYIFLWAFENDDNETKGLMNVMLLLIICQGFGNIHSYIARIGFYLMPYICLLIPKAIDGMKEYTKKGVSTVFVLFFTFYGIYSIYQSQSGWAQAYPWIPFWN